MKGRWKMIIGGPKFGKAITGIVFVLALSACDPPENETCFDIDGEEVCGTEGGTVQMVFSIDAAEAEIHVVRFHPDDARRYGLNEVVPLLADSRTDRTKAIIERLEPGPSQVCLTNDVYLQNTVDREQTIIHRADQCTNLLAVWSDADADWMPY